MMGVIGVSWVLERWTTSEMRFVDSKHVYLSGQLYYTFVTSRFDLWMWPVSIRVNHQCGAALQSMALWAKLWPNCIRGLSSFNTCQLNHKRSLWSVDNATQSPRFPFWRTWDIHNNGRPYGTEQSNLLWLGCEKSNVEQSLSKKPSPSAVAGGPSAVTLVTVSSMSAMATRP